MKNIQFTLILLLLFNNNVFATTPFVFNLSDVTGSVTQSNRIKFPVEFKQSTCQFTFEIIDNVSIENVTITHQNGCINNHRLLLDDYWYEWQAGFIFNFSSNSWTSIGSINLGACSTISGNTVLTGVPSMQVQSKLIQIDDQKPIRYFVDNNISYISFKTANADLQCANGTLFIPTVLTVERIFKNGFEI